jgi:ribosome-binding protein aMBF1 (putative translation factor)
MADDFLQEMLDESTAKNPGFPALYESAQQRRALMRELSEQRRRKGLSQTRAAAAMGTSQSAVARIESGEADPKCSTLERLAASLGLQVQYTLVPIEGGTRKGPR